MRISRSRNKHRQIAYTVELSEYDAEPPTRTWLLDDLPEKINPELEAVALYLIFGPWCGGEFAVPQKMGPNTAAAISLHAGMDFFPHPIEFYPKPIIRGAHSVTVTRMLCLEKEPSLTILDGAQWSGSLKSTSSIVISSNSKLFEVGDGLNTLLAPAVLLAEDLNLGTALVEMVGDRAEFEEYASLLREVGIALDSKVGC